MRDELARTLAKADAATFESDPSRFRQLGHAALKVLGKPIEAMVDAAFETVRFDEHWAIKSRRDFRKAVRALMNLPTIMPSNR